MLNLVIVEGIVQYDPVLRNNYYTTFGLVVDKGGDKNKIKGPTVDFVTCTAQGPMAIAFCKNIHKGSMVVVIGRMRSEHYDDYKGRTIYTTRVECTFIKYLSQPVKAIWADGFLSANPEIAEKYRDYAREQRRLARERNGKFNSPVDGEDPEETEDFENSEDLEEKET